MLQHYQALDSVYAIKLVYDPAPRTQTLKESITFLAAEYLAGIGLYCVQTSASVLMFESDRDRVLACIALSGSSSYTPVCVDDPWCEIK